VTDPPPAPPPSPTHSPAAPPYADSTAPGYKPNPPGSKAFPPLTHGSTGRGRGRGRGGVTRVVSPPSQAKPLGSKGPPAKVELLPLPEGVEEMVPINCMHRYAHLVIRTQVGGSLIDSIYSVVCGGGGVHMGRHGELGVGSCAGKGAWSWCSCLERGVVGCSHAAVAVRQHPASGDRPQHGVALSRLLTPAVLRCGRPAPLQHVVHNGHEMPPSQVFRPSATLSTEPCCAVPAVPQRVVYDGHEMPPSKFEAICGKQDAKKWKTSLWFVGANGQPEKVGG
jgi:hypothetical protein